MFQEVLGTMEGQVTTRIDKSKCCKVRMQNRWFLLPCQTPENISCQDCGVDDIDMLNYLNEIDSNPEGV